MIQQEHFEKFSLQKLKIRMSASPGRRRNFAGFSQLSPGEMYADPTGYPVGSPQFAFSRKTSYTAPPRISWQLRSAAGAAALRATR